MTRARIIKEEIIDKDNRFLAIYVDTGNAALVLLSETEDKLGTLAASVPSTSGIQFQQSLSSVLLGDRNTTTARMLAERLATKSGKIGLVSIHLKTLSETAAAPLLIKLFEKVTTETKARQQNERTDVIT
ncbi:MAG: hypothetical protein NWF11_03955 [Candidatus Bathyarchaeota archaeon]|nr:hypothetical protein [Candidatus Bathyarchaeota archaeon]